MKLLLTSGGITNASIANALFDLVGKKAEDTSLVFIPTAANAEKGDKGWFINDLINLQKLNLQSIDIADISAVDEEIWRPKLEEADVLFFEGGKSAHLMKWINKSGLISILPKLLQTKVYVGSSAGSRVTGPDLMLQAAQTLYHKDELTYVENVAALHLVDFYFLPHLNSTDFNLRTEANIKEAVKGIEKKIYALDDNSALKIVDGQVEVISEGKWLVINE